MSRGPFHDGELLAQAQAGAYPSGGGIRDHVVEQHRDFFAALPFAVAATAEAGWPAATLLEGPPGFISVPDPRRLRLAPRPRPGDPTRRLLRPGSPFALLGIDLESRRRNRANGVIDRVDDRGFEVAVEQSFGNCPQYIRPRRLEVVGGEAVPALPLVGLDAAARAAVGSADTFFVASSAGRSVDVSHRGGPPGFVAVDGETLTIPDYAGNRYFNTIGNLLLDDRAALLFVDFASGDLLHLRGRTEVVWSGPAVEALPGAQRLWRVRVEEGWRSAGAVGLRWSAFG